MTPAKNDTFKSSYIGLRTDIVSLIPATARGLTVLDVGCATGTTGNYLLDQGVAGRVYGIEYDEAMAAQARQRYQEVLVGDVEAMDLAALPRSIDLIIFGDVLEHLRAPERLLQQLVPLLSPTGRVIVSVPNMQHVSAIYQLAVKGYWPANDRGIFDRTHLRMFTRKNLTELVEQAGLSVIELKRVYRFRDRLGSSFPLYGRLLKWLFPDYYTFQYVVLAGRHL